MQDGTVGEQFCGKTGKPVFPELCEAGGITLVKFALPFDLVEPKLAFAELCGVGEFYGESVLLYIGT